MSKKLLFNNSGGGTEQESDWVEADMRCGGWETVNDFSTDEYESDGTYRHVSEVIYLDGLKEIHFQAANYSQAMALGVQVFHTSGIYLGTANISEVTTETDVINISKLREYITNAAGYEIIALAFEMYAEKNTLSVRYKLIR